MLRLATVTLAAGFLVAGCAAKSSSSSSPTTASSPANGGSSVTTSAAAGASCGSTTTAPGGTGGAEVTPPGDIPDNQAFVAYSPASGKYEVKVPEGWARKDGTDTVTFSDKFNAITIDTMVVAQAPTVQSVQATDVQKLTASARCFELGKVSTVTRPAGSAILITYKADAPPDAVTGKVVRDDVERYIFWKNGTEVVFTLAGSAGSDNVDPWKIVTESFTWR
jgi:hypothetical protein